MKIGKKLSDLTLQAINGLRGLGYKVLNKTGFPIISVFVGDTEKLVKTANMLFDEGILVTVGA
jgi:8-amino-7-oxononanoate synthase